ncbi:hypothetical protein D9615_001872 [Tricholomella constricta]|uniref:Uncharacterized protein n=1 Tax=Tricholomella constricta TaxID=117010 RepID=A0A8H5MAH5_9AGAR|nr:hypothetical protein D9615_001872 [Tricholomella constricta]
MRITALSSYGLLVDCHYHVEFDISRKDGPTILLSAYLPPLCWVSISFIPYIILAMVARPVPSDPYNPLPPAPENSDIIRHPSPFVPIRLPIFALVMWLNDTIVRILSVGPRKRPGHGRTLSDTTDAVEEGETMERKEISRPAIRPARDRVNIGRRKFD